MEFSEAERQRQLLEENMQKLRQSLRHWQTWEAEYEGLKEELVATGPADFSPSAVIDISKSYDGSLVNEKEILVLAGLDKPEATQRSYRQILNVIGRRQEYVQKSIETVQRQFFAAEGKLEEFAFASVTATGRYGDGAGEVDESGLPLTEIHEELDEEGNVLTSELRRPEENAGAVLERLRKAGMSKRDLGMEGGEVPKKSALHSPAPSPNAGRPVVAGSGDVAVGGQQGESGEDEGDGPRRPPIRKKSVSFTVDTKPAEEAERAESQEGRKSVSFNEKVAIARAADPPDTRSVSFSPTVEEIPAEPMGPPPKKEEASTTQTQATENSAVQQDLRASFKPGDKVYEITEEGETTTSHVVIPQDESEQDACLRREMLEYNLNEVNNVVAQMDLNDDDDDDDDDDEEPGDSHSEFTASSYQDEDTPYTSGPSEDEAEESEDDYGRSKHSGIPDAYHKEMQALQDRLIGNLGAAPEDEDIKDADPELNPDDVRRLVISSDASGNSNSSNKRSSISSAASSAEEPDKKAAGKKRVSFAEELDVAAPAAKSDPTPAKPIIEGVVERAPAPSHAPPAPAPPGKLSRFKQARTAPASTATATPQAKPGAADPHAPPTGPAGVPMASTLLERMPAPSSAKAPANPDDDDNYDPVLARRELAADYYRRRNDMVREQGGFAKGTGDEDEGLGELMEERDGKMKKVSRFKAARLGK